MIEAYDRNDPRLLVNIFGANMSDWKKPVEADDIVDGKTYFIAQKPVTRLSQWTFFSEQKNGKRHFTTKPGIALKYTGSDELRNGIRGKEGICCIEVPHDADKRWRARR